MTSRQYRPEHRHGLIFVSHAGEEKAFVESLLNAIEDTKIAAFFEDDIVVRTSGGTETMMSQAADADQVIVVLSRSYLTQEWPVKELGAFLKKDMIKIYPLYYKLTPDELWEIVEAYDDR